MKNNILYTNYLNSQKWANKRKLRLKIDNNKCTKCGNNSNLHIHHLTYERGGDENIETDLITLCDICHSEIHEDPTLKTKKKIRGGFRMSYLLYDEAVYNIITSKKDFEIITRIREKFTYKKVEVELSPTQLAKELNVSRQKISNVLKKMKDTKMIKQIYSNTYRFTPFMYIPFRANAEELQLEWSTTLDKGNKIKDK